MGTIWQEGDQRIRLVEHEESINILADTLYSHTGVRVPKSAISALIDALIARTTIVPHNQRFSDWNDPANITIVKAPKPD